MYVYVKAPPGHILRRRSKIKDNLRVAFSSVLLTLGFMAITTVVYPFISYQQTYAPKFASSPAILGTTDPTALIPSVQTQPVESPISIIPEVVNTALDYTNADAWYGHSHGASFDHLVYSLSIPKLRINNALVRSDHTDLKESLIHYPGTAQPGDLGNGVIFGHSVLPQFYNPTNYHTIFSTLHTLDVGDEILIQSGPARYTYRITQMYVTGPDDLSPLAQSYGARNLTLITCTPPGTYLKRLILKAELI